MISWYLDSQGGGRIACQTNIGGPSCEQGPVMTDEGERSGWFCVQCGQAFFRYDFRLFLASATFLKEMIWAHKVVASKKKPWLS